jgi:glutamate/tyrosine decarboxylase-like PLP-dependent enzyme
MAYGQDGYRNIVERNCYIAQQLGDWLDRQEEFDLQGNVRLNGVVFSLQGRPRMDAVRAYLDCLRDGGQLYLTPTIHFLTMTIRFDVAANAYQYSELAVRCG